MIFLVLSLFSGAHSGVLDIWNAMNTINWNW